MGIPMLTETKIPKTPSDIKLMHHLYSKIPGIIFWKIYFLKKFTKHSLLYWSNKPLLQNVATCQLVIKLARALYILTLPRQRVFQGLFLAGLWRKCTKVWAWFISGIKQVSSLTLSMFFWHLRAQYLFRILVLVKLAVPLQFLISTC